MERGKVDLRKCEKGDILISALGAELKYVRPTKDSEYLDHVVEYIDDNMGEGTRTHDGYVFQKNRIPATDHDIVRIIKLGDVNVKNINKKKYEKELAYVNEMSNDVLLHDYTLTDMLWYMKNYHESQNKIPAKSQSDE